MKISEQEIKNWAVELRHGGQVAWLAGVGPMDMGMAGQVVGGVVVVLAPNALPEGTWIYRSIWVDRPWLACAELGAE